MKHKFKFAHKSQVIAFSYDNPRAQHNAIVLKRWLEEHNQPSNSNTVVLDEHYEVMLGNGQIAEFLVDDLIARNPKGF